METKLKQALAECLQMMEVLIEGESPAVRKRVKKMIKKFASLVEPRVHPLAARYAKNWLP